MPQTVKLDPLTRVEGHLAVRTEVEGNKVQSAYVSGEMFRGFEVILRGRDPLDAQHVTQRVCGVCSVEHGIASILAQDMAYGLRPADNGRLCRNLMQAANFIASHITHFYLLSGLDFVDIAAIGKYEGSDPALLELKAWAKAETDSKKVSALAPFLPRYAGQYATDLALNVGALRHYLDAMEMRMLGQRLAAIFTGKMPHAATLIPGGVIERITTFHLEQARALLHRLQVFIDTAYLPDVVAVAGAFPDYFNLGRTAGNFLAYGVFPESADASERWLPGGVSIDGRYQPLDAEQVAEDVGSSLFSSPSGLKPTRGQTVPAPNKAGAYSWLKAPRYDGRPMEVGPLARMLVAYQSGKHAGVKAGVDDLLKKLQRDPKDLNSVMGRHAVRALECKLVADHCATWLDQLAPDAPSTVAFQVPDAAQGYGLTEAARGALGHWLEIRDKKISNYQLVVPTTWNASPRDDRGQPGPIEQALVGTPVADPANPLEVARVVRSFDPCLACAVH